MPSASARATEPTLYKELVMMFRWVFFVILAVLIVSWLFSMRLPWLEKLGLTKLSSNLTFRAFGKVRRIPVTYVVLLATAAYLTVALLYK
jgi:ABC-type multidrug transport system fused ATPase/permease subunit